MGQPPVTKGQAKAGSRVRDLLAATQLLLATFGWCRPWGRFGVLFILGFPLLPRSCMGNNSLPAALLLCSLEVELLLLTPG